MKAISQISESELEVMKILWELGKSKSSLIVDKLTQTTKWKPKTIQTLINRLVAKEAIKAEKTTGKAYIYSPLVNESDYKAHANDSFLQKLYNGSINLMLTSFIRDNKISKAEIDSLKKLLDEEE